MKDLTKRKPIRSDAIRKAANGEACTVCGRNDGTTVFCHLNESWAGKGMGRKAEDIYGFFGCANCHNAYDGRSRRNFISTEEALRAVCITWARLIVLGIITIKGMK